MAKPWLLNLSGNTLVSFPKNANFPAGRSRKGPTQLENGDIVAIVGGGIAGTAFARQLFLQSQEANLHLKVVIFNSRTCNYCGGLITNLSKEMLVNKYKLSIPSSVELWPISEVVYANRSGETVITLGHHLTATLRTSRFGVRGLDDALRESIFDSLDRGECDFELIEPAKVTRILPSKKPGEGVHLEYKIYHQGKEPENGSLYARLVVLASGLRSLESKMMREFCGITGYRPPKVIQASVAEIDASKIKRNLLEQRIMIIDNLIPGSMVALISKGRNWITIAGLQKKLTEGDLDIIFNHPAVRKYIDFPEASAHLKCKGVCPASVFTGPAKAFYGNGWVAVGDLAGYGRVLKDGYFGALSGAYFAAITAVKQGLSEEDFAYGYHRPLKSFNNKNSVGMLLFNLNSVLSRRRSFSGLIIKAIKEEQKSGKSGGYLQGAIRALTNGELSYAAIAALFVIGLINYFLRWPLLFFSSLRPKPLPRS